MGVGVGEVPSPVEVGPGVEVEPPCGVGDVDPVGVGDTEPVGVAVADDPGMVEVGLAEGVGARLGVGVAVG
jgi:hypothetical protein